MTRKKEIEQKAFEVYPEKLGYSTIIEKTVDYNRENREIWIAGAEWADAHPVHYDGKAYLYVLHKGVEQGKRRMLDEVCEWLKENGTNYWWDDEDDDGLNDLRKAMEE